MTDDCPECGLNRRRVTAPITSVATFDSDSQVLITQHADGRTTYAARPYAGATWGRPVEAVAR